MNDPTPFSPSHGPAHVYRSEPPPSRLPVLILILAALIGVLLLPFGAEQVQYALKRGELRAEAEAAEAELAKLGEKASLVKLADTSLAFRLVAKRIEPSVVHINVESIKVMRRDMEDEFGRLFNLPLGQRVRGQGSGFIVDAERGFVVTNYHVVQDANKIDVQLADGRTVSGVDLVGYDVLTDMAVLKLDAGNLRAVEWGDSDKLEVGDWVLAVGNPYGLDGSVSVGIVSAKERRGVASRSPYQDFLQTDAAVNPGNSGGPLIDVTGKIVGINTAIVGEAFRGISFAIPSNTAKDVYGRLIEGGRVARGWLGVGLDNLTPEELKNRGLEKAGGAQVRRVVPDSPAAQAGLQEGDIIVQWDGKPVTDAMELTLRIAKTPIGAEVEVIVLRGDAPRTLAVTVGQRPMDEAVRE